MSKNISKQIKVKTDCRYFRTFGRCAVDNKKPNCENCGCYTFKYSKILE